MKCEISLLSRVLPPPASRLRVSQIPAAAQHRTSLLRGEQSTTEPSASAVLSIKDELKKMGAATTGLPDRPRLETAVRALKTEDYIIFILLAYNSPLQSREKKDREDVIIKILL